jgi:hypothetical protein
MPSHGDVYAERTAGIGYKREFEDLLKQELLEFDLCSQGFECRMIPCAEPGGRSQVKRTDAELDEQVLSLV